MTGKSSTILIISPSSSWQEVLEQCRQPALNILSLPDIIQLSDIQAKPDILLADMPQHLLEGTVSALQEILPGVPTIILSEQQQSLPDDMTLLHKPVRVEVLFECIAAHVSMQETPLTLGQFFLFTRGKYLTYGEHPVPDSIRLKLTEKEVDILSYLSENKNKITDKETLLSQVWGYGEGIDTHTVETHIYRLRQKIAEQFDGNEVIITSGGGYTLSDK